MKQTVKKIGKKAAAVTLVAAMALSIAPVVKGEAKVSVKSGTYSYYKEKTNELWMIDIQKKGTKVKVGIVWSNKTKAYGTKKYFTKKIASKISFNVKGEYVGTKKTKNIKGTITFKGNKLKCKINGQSFTAKKVTDPDPSRDNTGSNAWEAPESPVIDEAVKAYAEKAISADLPDATYTPFALIGKKESSESGQEFKVFCRKTDKKLGGKTTYSVVDLRANLIGDVSVSNSYETDIEAYGTGDPDGWNEVETPEISKAEGLVFDKAVEGLDGVSYKALALLAKRKTNETDYCFIAEMTTVTPDAVPTYVLLYINENDEGKVVLDTTKTKNLENA